jgi:hypothetical protein
MATAIAAAAVSWWGCSRSDIEFDILLARSHQERQSRSGQIYEVVSSLRSTQTVARFLEDCMSFEWSVADPSFDMIIVVGSEGEVQDVKVRPANDLSNCARNLAGASEYPKPPFAPFHLLISIQEEIPSSTPEDAGSAL